MRLGGVCVTTDEERQLAMQRPWQQDKNSTTRHTWRLNQLGQADDDDIFVPPQVTRDDLLPPERGKFKLHDPLYTVKYAYFAEDC